MRRPLPSAATAIVPRMLPALRAPNPVVSLASPKRIPRFPPSMNTGREPTEGPDKMRTIGAGAAALKVRSPITLNSRVSGALAMPLPPAAGRARNHVPVVPVIGVHAGGDAAVG